MSAALWVENLNVIEEALHGLLTNPSAVERNKHKFRVIESGWQVLLSFIGSFGKGTKAMSALGVEKLSESDDYKSSSDSVLSFPDSWILLVLAIPFRKKLIQYFVSAYMAV